MRSKQNIFKNIDWLTIWLYAIMVILGWINIYAATYNEEHQSIFDITQSYGKQLIWIGTALLLIWVIFMLEAQFFSTFAYVFYGVGLVLLIGVLVFGTEIKGAKAWFSFGAFSFQPAEFAKYATALAITKYLNDLSKKYQQFQVKFTAIFLLITPAILIMLQPDTGSTLVFASFIFVLYREGLSGNVLLIGLAATTLFILTLLLNDTGLNLPFNLILQGKYILIFGIGLIMLLVLFAQKKPKKVWLPFLLIFLVVGSYIFSVNYAFDNILSPHQQDRINELLGITSDPTGAGYNVNQSKIAIGSGGLWGKGFLEGTQTKFDFVPEQSTDFIFCTVGEEWGFAGSFIIISLFVALLFRLIILAERQRSNFTRIYLYCTASIIFFHFAVNLGMTMGLAPVIGIPLPFFSYGGSSLWSFTVLLFTGLRLDSERMYVLR